MKHIYTKKMRKMRREEEKRTNNEDKRNHAYPFFRKSLSIYSLQTLRSD